ncbi:DUF2306 domain-containing protein [Oceanibaculum pacificum]|uniref:DUF2306 domain-containing protein n=1 Tax=Oceanibaculum pacificum TaxID=580166 RepID=A0A154VNH9_9PROT|nr:DUF2306 domain-containing protein [Oceanibaculum pacificum]KZD02866.1 hypothetical protein AUP43_13330 [Oceanibaculum pacificum]
MSTTFFDRDAGGARLLWGVAALASVAIALASFRYLVGFGPMPEPIMANAYANPWLPVHVAAAATALLVGAFQFLGGVRRRWPALHRWTGRVYVFACLVGAVSGFVLALGTTTGPVATAGFGTLSVAWLITTLLGWRRATQRRFAAHRAWMIRSWWLTFAAVTLRIYLGASFATGLPFELSYPAISFLCWVPNLIAAELYLRRQSA